MLDFRYSVVTGEENVVIVNVDPIICADKGHVNGEVILIINKDVGGIVIETPMNPLGLIRLKLMLIISVVLKDCIGVVRPLLRD